MKPRCGLMSCSESHYAKGYCKAHYNRVWYTGRVGNSKIVKRSRSLGIKGTCNIAKCKNSHYAKGMCQSHYTLARAGSKANEDQRSCNFPNCKLIHVAKGYCAGHYMAIRSVTFSRYVG